MHSIQSSKGRHNIFSETDHDRKLVDTVSQKTKSSKRVAFADTGVVLPPISSPTSSTVLPDIDLNVRKKLASNDLHVKFSHKSNVLTVASTLSKKEKSGKDGNEDTPGMDIEGGNHDDLDRISVKSNWIMCSTSTKVCSHFWPQSHCQWEKLPFVTKCCSSM